MLKNRIRRFGEYRNTAFEIKITEISQEKLSNTATPQTLMSSSSRHLVVGDDWKQEHELIKNQGGSLFLSLPLFSRSSPATESLEEDVNSSTIGVNCLCQYFESFPD